MHLVGQHTIVIGHVTEINRVFTDC